MQVGYRRCQRTRKMITSPGCWRPLNGLCKLIGMEFYLIRMPPPKFATKLSKREPALKLDPPISAGAIAAATRDEGGRFVKIGRA